MNPVSDKRRTPELPRRILFLNDLGFQYGAGIAQSRQLECLMGLGIEVGLLTWSHGNIKLEDVAIRVIDPDLWLGIREVGHLVGGELLSDETVISGLVMEVAKFNAEIVIVGNLQAARWPIQLLTALRGIGCRVLRYAHDAHLFIDRCVDPGEGFPDRTGRNDTCSTALSHTARETSHILAPWQIHRDVFSDTGGIEVIANSQWSKKLLHLALPTCPQIDTIELGANEEHFKPGDSHAARALLSLPDDKPIVLCSAINFQKTCPGSQSLLEIVATLADEITFVALGQHTGAISGMIGLDYHLGSEKLALVYQAADIFLSTTTEEAFSQTVVEAQLCGLPVVAFKDGGGEEVVRNEITGKLVTPGDVAEAVAAIRAMLADDRFMAVASPWARQLALTRFSMGIQEHRWHTYLVGHKPAGTGHNPPIISYELNEREDLNDTGRYRPSWLDHASFINDEHGRIYEKTSRLDGWQTPGDSYKLYEMGYHAGDVILEIGTFGGRSATIELRGALANPARDIRPQFYGIDISDDAISQTRQVIAGEMLGQYCHLFHGVLQDFVKRWEITPTMVFLDADHTYEGVAADLRTLSAYLKPGTPILMHDFLHAENDTGGIGVKKAAQEWATEGNGRFVGCFGCCALYVTLTR